MADAFGSLATSTISTKRRPAVSGGLRGAAVTYLTNVKVLPIMPNVSGTTANAVVMRMAVTGQAVEAWLTYTQKHAHTKSSVSVNEIPDIREGDILVDGSVEYDVKYVGNWPATDLTGFLEISLEENKP